MHLQHIISQPSIRFVIFPPYDFQFLVYPQVHDVWVFVIRGDLMIEDKVYSAGRHIYQLRVRRLRVFRWVFVTGDVSVAADWVGHHAGARPGVKRQADICRASSTQAGLTTLDSSKRLTGKASGKMRERADKGA